MDERYPEPNYMDLNAEALAARDPRSNAELLADLNRLEQELQTRSCANVPGCAPRPRSQPRPRRSLSTTIGCGANGMIPSDPIFLTRRRN